VGDPIRAQGGGEGLEVLALAFKDEQAAALAGDVERGLLAKGL
jgi:hypothetical protein